MVNYDIKELSSVWMATSTDGKLKASYKVSKSECPTRQEAEAFFSKLLKDKEDDHG